MIYLEMRKIPLHFRILFGMLLGVGVGILALQFDSGPKIVDNWIKPFGDIFISLLKLIAVPIVITSLIKGVTDLRDISTFSKLGSRTIILYLITTVIAVIIGLTLVNVFEPGVNVQSDSIAELSSDFTEVVNSKLELSDENAAKGPLRFLVDMVPDNFFLSASNNSKMLQIIFFTLFFSIGLLLIPSKIQEHLKSFFDSMNAVLLKMIDLIMIYAPYAIVALIATLIVESSNADLFFALLNYALVLLGGMALLMVLYIVALRMITGKPMLEFIRGMLPAQLVALSTSSSMATLPVTMECVEENLGVDNEVASFVCPVGATINMDATGLMQAIAAVFVCQVLGFDLGLSDQLTIVLTATLASIGAAAAPSAGIIMLVIVLESVGFPSESLPIALAMILSIDRPLDMCRTVVNITGDGFVSVLVAKSIGRFK